MNLKGLTKKQREKAIASSVGWMELKIRRLPENGYTEMIFVAKWWMTRKEMKTFNEKREYMKDSFWFKGKRGTKHIEGYIEAGKLVLDRDQRCKWQWTKFETIEAMFVDSSNPDDIVFRCWEYNEETRLLVEVTGK